MPILGPNGLPIAPSTFKKAPAPKMGPAFGNWAGRDVTWNQLPGSAILQFDLSALTLADYRAMRHHPQINASLSVLTFMIHQIDWRMHCDDKKIQDEGERQMRAIWTRLVRGLSQAFWAGYSPMVLEFDNNMNPDIKKTEITKVKDLIPEECLVNWKEVEGWAPLGNIPPKFKTYDGIRQFGGSAARGMNGYPTASGGYIIPPENTLWYPLMMENGDYYGRKLLKAAFSPWYFSVLVHLFANRYYERFGEPTPIGRADFNAEVEDGNGGTINGKTMMENILMNLRNRSVVTLPSDRDPVTKEYDYDLEYLESQMRGADFERYLARLDEEMSLAIFTPILLMRTGDVGSNNLGVQHTQTWLWMLNALAGDMKEYIDRYVCERIKSVNFSTNAPPLTWEYRKMGKESVETVRAIMQALLSGDKATVDLDELGQVLGMTVKEIRVSTDINDPENSPDTRDRSGRTDRKEVRKGPGESRATGREVSARIQSQVEKAFRDGTFAPGFKPSLGYERRMTEAFRMEGLDKPEEKTTELYERVDQWLVEAIGLGSSEYSGPKDFMAMFGRMLDNELEKI